MLRGLGARVLSMLAPSPPAGTTAAIGGAFDSPRIFRTMRESSARGTKPRIAVVLTSKADSPSARAAYFRDKRKDGRIVDPSMRRWFARNGFEPIYIPITVDNHANAAHDHRLAELIASCDAVYLAGGDQAKHVRCLLQEDGSDTPVMRAIRSVAEKGGLVAGSSAGAAAQGDVQYGAGSTYGYLVANRLLDHRIEAGTLHNEEHPEVGSLQKGLGVLRDDVLVCTHFDQRFRLGRLLVALRAAQERGKQLFGIGVDEDTGLFARGPDAKIAGTHGVFFADASEATYPPGAPYQASGVRLTYLTNGDRIDLDDHRVKTDKPLRGCAPIGGTVISNDILAPMAMTKLIQEMVRTGADRAVGYTKETDPRFRFELARDARTRTYDDGKQVTVTDLLLSVGAVR